jgi:hypothetical protein
MFFGRDGLQGGQMGLQEDPVVRSARREAVVVFVVWIAAFAYTVGYCLLYAYGRSAESLAFVLGFPDWVFWGILVPWTVCLCISCWFAYCFMTDEDLGDETAAVDEPREVENAS